MKAYGLIKEYEIGEHGMTMLSFFKALWVVVLRDEGAEYLRGE